jgi:hypothetical protein
VDSDEIPAEDYPELSCSGVESKFAQILVRKFKIRKVRVVHKKHKQNVLSIFICAVI